MMTASRTPVLAVVDFPAMPGAALRPLVDPVPLSPVSLVWRKGLVHPALDALKAAAAELARDEGWLSPPVDRWIPATDFEVMSRPFRHAEHPRTRPAGRHRAA